MQLQFDRQQKENPFNEKISARPQDLKQSVLKDLYVTGALDEFPFKFRVTAFLLSKGLRNAQDAVEIFNNECLGLKKFYSPVAAYFAGMYTTQDFYIHQSILESLIAKILKLAFSDRKELSILDIWRRLSHVRASLTDKQGELLQILYLAEPALTYQEASVFLGISLDSVRDREAGILLKFRKEFPELRELEPYKDWTKNQKRFYTYRGLVHLPSVEIRHPCFRIRNINGQ